jgi:hypothetical protein
MTVSRYGKELAEMMKLWNCDERTTIQQFLQAIYIAKGNRPEAVAEWSKHYSNEELARQFVAVMDASRKELSFIDLLALQPTK